MMHLPKVNKMQMMTILGTVVGVSVFCFLIIRQYESTNNSLNKLSLLKKQLSTVQLEMEETRKSIKRFEEEQKEFKATLFDERDVPAFLDGVSNSASQFLVHVIEMKTQQFSEVKVPKEMLNVSQLAKVKVNNDNEKSSKLDKSRMTDVLTLASMPIHIKINGTFEAIVRFLNSIENYQQLLTVSNVEIVARQNYPQLTCEFNLRIYSLKTFKDINL